MDFSKFKVSDWLKVGGAAGMLIFGFFDWAKIGPFSFNNAFDYVRGLIAWVLTVGVGVLTLLMFQGKKFGSIQLPVVNVLAAAVAVLMMIFMVVFGPGDASDPAAGLWLSFFSTIVALAGSVMAFLEGGGNLKDLTDVEKLKRGFGKN